VRAAFVSAGASVAAGFGYNANGIGIFCPLFGSQRETIETRELSKPVEFDGYKIRFIEMA
jgi:hypothetical protein